MRYEAKKLTLKDGKSLVLRPLGPEDAEAMLDFLRVTSTQTTFLARYTDEVTTTLEEEKTMLAQRLEDPFLVDMAAFTADGELMGNCTLHRLAAWYRMAHRAEMSIAIRQSHWHMGLGTLLVERAIQAAREMPGIEQVELTVMGKNRRAMALYERLGFVRVGERPKAFRFRDGSYDSEIQMQRLL